MIVYVLICLLSIKWPADTQTLVNLLIFHLTTSSIGLQTPFSAGCTRQYIFWHSILCHPLHMRIILWQSYNTNYICLSIHFIQLSILPIMKFPSTYIIPITFQRIFVSKKTRILTSSVGSVCTSLPYVKTAFIVDIVVLYILNLLNNVNQAFIHLLKISRFST